MSAGAGCRTGAFALGVLALVAPGPAPRVAARAAGEAVLAPAADSLAAAVRALVPVVEGLRGHRFLRPVPVEVVSDSVARLHFLARLARFDPDARLAAETRAYTALGLLPTDTDLRTTLLGVLEEQAGGYYDPSRGAFFLLDDMPPGLLPVLAAHEMTHALDDQLFGIDSTLTALGEDDDAVAAFGAVVEGSGTLVMSVYVVEALAAGRIAAEALAALQESEVGRAAALGAAPPLVRRSLLAPYLLGQTFLLGGDPLRLLRGVPAQDVDRAFRDPPRSTEQLLHPEAYWDSARVDVPQSVALPDFAPVLGAGWGEVATGSLGELLLALLCGARDPGLQDPEIVDPASWTVPAATGWDGDRWTLWRRGEEWVTVLGAVWDTEADARECAAALQLPAECRAAQRGSAVAVVASSDAARAADLLERTLSHLAGPR